MSSLDYSLTSELAKELKLGLKKLNVPANENQCIQLLQLLEGLYKWNKAYNLTAIKSPREGLKLHILDSLTLYSFIKEHKEGCSVLDVGTGPGFPGLPLAIMFSDLQFSLLDSNSKKIRFIRQMAHQLSLTDVEPIHERVEQLKNRTFELIVSRAFASINDMLTLTQPLLSNSGKWLAMKGDVSQEELDNLPGYVMKNSVEKVNIPGVSAERCIVDLSLNDSK